MCLCIDRGLAVALSKIAQDIAFLMAPSLVLRSWASLLLRQPVIVRVHAGTGVAFDCRLFNYGNHGEQTYSCPPCLLECEGYCYAQRWAGAELVKVDRGLMEALGLHSAVYFWRAV